MLLQTTYKKKDLTKNQRQVSSLWVEKTDPLNLIQIGSIHKIIDTYNQRVFWGQNRVICGPERTARLNLIQIGSMIEDY